MGEKCDDGANGDDTDGCKDDCTTTECGDGVMDTGEQCDDGANGVDSDGCRDDCTIPSCGDGILDTSMDNQCDDGANGDSTDGCRDDCTIPTCGDGIVDEGEMCDDGGTSNSDDTALILVVEMELWTWANNVTVSIDGNTFTFIHTGICGHLFLRKTQEKTGGRHLEDPSR